MPAGAGGLATTCATYSRPMSLRRFTLSQLVLPGMRARTSGRIITIGSTGGRFTSPGAGAYHVVKYGVEALSLSLGAEVAQFGVRVVLIDPTGVRTPSSHPNSKRSASYPDDDPYGGFKIATPRPPAD